MKLSNIPHPMDVFNYTKIFGIALWIIGTLFFILIKLLPQLSISSIYFPELTIQNYATFTAGCITLIGWAGTIYFNNYNSIKKHTIDVLLKAKLSTDFDRHAENLRGFEGPLTKKEWESEDNVFKAVMALLNYYEFIAVGIKSRDLDEFIVKNTIRTTIIKVYEKSEPYLEHIRTNKGQASACEHLRFIVDKWKKE